MLCPSNFGKSPDFSTGVPSRLISLVVHIVPSQSLDRLLWDLMQTSALQEINRNTFNPLIFQIWHLTSEQSSKKKPVTIIQWLPSGYHFKLDPQLLSAAMNGDGWKNYTHGNPLRKKGQKLAQVSCFLFDWLGTNNICLLHVFIVLLMYCSQLQ